MNLNIKKRVIPNLAHWLRMPVAGFYLCAGFG